MVERQAFHALYRVRRANLQQQSRALYRRYAHVIAIFLALFGTLLSERPSLPAEPLLHFWQAPSHWAAGLVHIACWLALVSVWASLHREPVRGGALAVYSRSLPLGGGAGALVDLSMLALSLRIFLLPFALACWIAIRSGNAGGADQRFLLYLVLIAALTFSTARSTVYGASAQASLAQAAGVAALVFSGQLDNGWLALALTVAALAACIGQAVRTAGAGASRGRAGAASRSPPGQRRLPLLRLQFSLLVQMHPHAAAMRLLLAALPQLAACWMIVAAGKTAEAYVFLHLACAATAAITSGLFHLFYMAKAPLQPFLRSIACGPLRLAIAEHSLVAAATAMLYGMTLLVLGAGLGIGSPSLASLAGAALFWLACLPLLGLPLIQRHRDGILMKFTLLIAALLLVLNL